MQCIAAWVGVQCSNVTMQFSPRELTFTNDIYKEELMTSSFLDGYRGRHIRQGN
jgi:hypothetical protein